MSNLNFDEFVFKGVNCKQFGIHAIGQPIYTRPSIRASQVTIPGRSGALTILEGDDIFEATAFAVSCIIDDDSRLDEIAAFYKGQGDVEFYSLPGGYYRNAFIVNQIPFSKIVRGNPHRSFSLEFQCSNPFFYLDHSTYIPTDNQMIFTQANQLGNIDSRPVFNFDCWGSAGDKIDFEVTKGDYTETFMTFELPADATEESPIHVTIDNEMMYAYGILPSSEATVPFTGYLSGEWIKLFPMSNGTGNMAITMRCYNSEGEITEDPPAVFTYFEPNWRRI